MADQLEAVGKPIKRGTVTQLSDDGTGSRHRKTGHGGDTLGLNKEVARSWKLAEANRPTRPAGMADVDVGKAHRLIKEQAAQIEALTKQVTGLKGKLENAQATNCEVSSFLNQDIVGKEQQARKLSEVLEQRTKAFERASGRLKEQMERQLREQKSEFDAIELNLRREVAELKEDNKQLLHFRGRQAQMDKLVESLKHEAKGLKEDIEAQDFSWHQKFASTKAALESEYGTALDTAKEAARTEAREELAKEVLAQQKEKVQISKDLEEQKRDREGYLRDRKQLRETLSQLGTEKSLMTQQLQEQQQQLASLHKHNAELFHVCKALKMKMDALMQELVQSRPSDQLVLPMFEDPDDGSLHADLVEELEQRQTILKAAKRLGRKVLMQRADLETFLTDTIQVCRDQVVIEQKQKKRNQRVAGTSLSVVRAEDESMQQDPASASTAQDAGNSGDAPSSAQLDVQDQDPGPGEDPEGKDDASAGISTFKSVPISKLSWRQRELLIKMIHKKVNECAKEIGPTRNKLKHAIRVL